VAGVAQADGRVDDLKPGGGERGRGGERERRRRGEEGGKGITDPWFLITDP